MVVRCEQRVIQNAKEKAGSDAKPFSKILPVLGLKFAEDDAFGSNISGEYTTPNLRVISIGNRN